MLVRKSSLIAILLSSLCLSCQGGVGKYDLKGIWNAECFDDREGKKLTATFYYESNTFRQRLHKRHQNKEFSLHSGTYQATNSKLKLAYQESDFPQLLAPPYNKSTKNLSWLDAHSILISGGGVDCYAYRQTSSK